LKDGATMIRIVYVLRGSFFTQYTGGRVKTAALASALAAAGDLTLIDLSRNRYPGPRLPTGQRFELPYGGVARIHSSLRANRPWIDWVSKLTGKVFEPNWLWRSRAARSRATLELVHTLRPDVLVVDHPMNASLGLAAPAGARILHTHNVESELAAASAEQTGKRRFLKRVELLRGIERDLLPQFDQVWGVREEDLAVYRKLGVKHCVLTPNVIADAVFRRNSVTGVPGSVLMVGSLNYRPNAEAARYLLQLGERSAATGPPLAITIAGNRPGAELVRAAAEHAWLRVPGFVPDLQAVVDHAATIAVPLPWGAGTKVKVLEALAMGKPLVTTPSGAEGIAIQDGVHALVRPLGPAFDEAVNAVARDPGHYMEMARRGRELAWTHYSQNALTASVVAAIQAAAAGPRRADRP